jgi:hypothetical protein
MKRFQVRSVPKNSTAKVFTVFYIIASDKSKMYSTRYGITLKDVAYRTQQIFRWS